MKNILFRADSSSEIGIGHITRDLVLAKQYKLDSITFATQDLPGNINDYIRKCGHRLLHLKSNAVEEMINIISDEKIDMIVIDHYGIDLEYEKKLKEQCDILLLVLDDTYQPHFCDILLNHNLYADESKYAGLIPERCELRCGAEYTLIDDQFMDENLKISNLSDPRSHFNVFVAMGGSDHSNILMKILLVLAEYPNLRPIVVTSTAKQHLEELIKYVAGKASVSLHVNPENMASLMHNSDYAIITPSALVHEILQFQLPFIAIKTADNQSHMLEYLKDSHFITMECFDSELLLTNVRKLIGEPGSIFKNFIDLSMSEKLMILDWRNNPGIRKWMLAKETISQ
ncbi:MAG: UDP-2,4-diacetamido-2,4,6-trideoxy-beta-L-altropyranose hydrolase, partial [Candidatus Marinimicrobia bacterium]|nr:UDP-2,4-diacetamido-2,4,6-trideoxy-beta-L-altropyranose hydrolase [Candidatus Neomarinimicrobiota bacterium]